jgi:ubiquinone/menaquinone biosynthesis C-methylase UbiE
MGNGQAEHVDHQQLYATGDRVRMSFDRDEQRATAFFDDYVTFVTRSAGRTSADVGNRLLDVGCGAGWSSFLFAQSGHQVTGIDLNANAFEPPATEGLRLMEGSVLQLPFSDASYDVVAAYNTLEHIPEPQRALQEMLRVCRPSGLICVVGPNLLSPYQSLKFLAMNLKRGTFRRRPGMARHPFGNTVPESLASLPTNVGRTLRKLTSPSGQTSFLMRVPDPVPPIPWR